MTQAVANYRLREVLHKASAQIKDAETRFLHTLITLEGVRKHLQEDPVIEVCDKIIADLKTVIIAMDMNGVDNEELLK
jgi:hypothetical protein